MPDSAPHWLWLVVGVLLWSLGTIAFAFWQRARERKQIDYLDPPENALRPPRVPSNLPPAPEPRTGQQLLRATRLSPTTRQSAPAHPPAPTYQSGSTLHGMGEHHPLSPLHPLHLAQSSPCEGSVAATSPSSCPSGGSDGGGSSGCDGGSGGGCD